MSHSARSAYRSFQHRRSSVNRELSFTIEHNEHLFRRVVKMVSDSAPWHNLAAMNKIQVDVHRGRRNEQFAGHVSRAVMGSAARVLARIRMANALRQWIARENRRC